MIMERQTCKQLCGREKPCGNIFCSNNPKYRKREREQKPKHVKPKPYYTALRKSYEE